VGNTISIEATDQVTSYTQAGFVCKSGIAAQKDLRIQGTLDVNQIEFVIPTSGVNIFNTTTTGDINVGGGLTSGDIILGNSATDHFININSATVITSSSTAGQTSLSCYRKSTDPARFISSFRSDIGGVDTVKAIVYSDGKIECEQIELATPTIESTGATSSPSIFDTTTTGDITTGASLTTGDITLGNATQTGNIPCSCSTK